ncbi:ORF6N domain-containing protein [Enterocloster lavalensis]|uniref:ORF6N domain-containing protein n=1 Tax=Enterocloster lavalensis TaxID=460384 RepID=UPI001D08E466|nr:ORF6N domain-containing protein [Enterocloster lavalensis]MCB6343640.1 ORF6N domain-containing protein [Enterocloster lavalensis]
MSTDIFTNDKMELTIQGRQRFMGKEIPVVLGGFGEGKRCVSDKTIAEIHKMEPKHVRERISQNINRFKKSVDYIDIKQRVGETGTLEFLLKLGYAKQSITQAEHIYILSERGYAKLIKIMDTDLAWEIHDQLIDEYFKLREEQAFKIDRQLLSPQTQLILQLAESISRQEIEQKRQAEQLIEMKNDVKNLEAKITTHPTDYYTIAGYASLKNIRMDVTRANLLGRKAVKLSKEYEYVVGKITDPRFGTVNTYHIDILDEVFRKF